jgi:effector-binding domain-containing protein
MRRTDQFLKSRLIAGSQTPLPFPGVSRRITEYLPANGRKIAGWDNSIASPAKLKSFRFSDTDSIIDWRYSMDRKSVSVEVKEVPGETVAYVRHVGPYAGVSAAAETR